MHFLHAVQTSSNGLLSQWLVDRRGQFMNGKTGSWKTMFKRLRIKHNAGSDQQSLTLPISDFIGLWGCATGTIANIHLASDEAISSDAKFIGNVSSYISCFFCSSKTPNLSYRVGSKYDMISAWC